MSDIDKEIGPDDAIVCSSAVGPLSPDNESCRSSAEPVPRLYEVAALVRYAVVIYANSEVEALNHVKTWEDAWHDSADLVGVCDVEVVDVRDATSVEDEAHEIIASVPDGR